VATDTGSAPLKVIGYARVSTAEQAQDGVSLPAQSAKIHQFCGLHDLELVGLVEDRGASAKTLDRPGLRSALARLDAGEARGLVVAKLDRLTRSVVDLGKLVEVYFGGDRPRAQLLSVADSIDTRTATGRLILNFIVMFAQWERETIVERTLDAMSHKRSRGERLGGIPFGSKLDPDDPRLSKSKRPVALVPCPRDLATLVLIRQLRGEGLSLQAIADALNDRGIPGKRGVTRRSTGRWSKSSVHEILTRGTERTGGEPGTHE